MQPVIADELLGPLAEQDGGQLIGEDDGSWSTIRWAARAAAAVRAA
ncbi:MAG: hypothetical protein ACR2MP_16645 [Streptosporangiaceae bacterium]